MKLTKFAMSLLAGSAILAATIVVPAQGKAGHNGGNNQPPPQFVPEIGYGYKTSRYEDIRLANRAGDQSILVDRENSRIQGFDLSSEQAKMIAYAVDGNLYIRSWIASPLSIGPATLIFPSSSAIEYMDFSPDDKEIVFEKFNADHSSEMYVVTNLDGATPTVTLQPIQNYSIGPVRFSPEPDSNGNYTTIFFTGASTPDTYLDGLYRYKLGESSATLVLPSAGNFDFYDFDVSRPYPGYTPELIMDEAGQVKLFDLNGTQISSPNLPNNGTGAYLNCDNQQILYDSDRSIKITDLASGATETWASDRNIGRLDWLRRDPCQ